MVKGKRTTMLIIPELGKWLGYRGPIAILEPYRIDVDAEYGLTTSYQALGSGLGWRGASTMPPAASRLTMIVERAEPAMPFESDMLADGVYRVGDQYAWQCMASKPRLFANVVAAWKESFTANWMGQPDGIRIALRGRVVKGNLKLMQDLGEVA